MLLILIIWGSLCKITVKFNVKFNLNDSMFLLRVKLVYLIAALQNEYIEITN